MGDQGPIFFFKEDDPEWGWLYQWFPSPITDEDGIVFKHAEQYMMYHKALTFSDTKTANEILLTSSPRKCKGLGKATKGFEDAVWEKVKSQVVEQGSYLKYTHSEGLKKKLLATDDRELVEASHFDRVWGVGFSPEMCRRGKKGGAGRELWGQNLLGKALMAARNRIREEKEAKAEVVVAEKADG